MGGAFQADCPRILKTKGVNTDAGSLAYKFTPLEDIISQVSPLLQKHGFSFKFDTDVSSVVGWVVAKCIVTHSSGHFEISTAKFPLGGKTKIMSDTQVYGAAMTFASRRVFCNAFGIVTAGEDNDAIGHKPKPAGPSTLAPDSTEIKDLARELWNILKSVRGVKPDWGQANVWLWREEILDAAAEESAPHLSAVKFRDVIAKAKAKLPNGVYHLAKAANK